jgi:hypothetical protein
MPLYPPPREDGLKAYVITERSPEGATVDYLEWATTTSEAMRAHHVVGISGTAISARRPTVEELAALLPAVEVTA